MKSVLVIAYYFPPLGGGGVHRTLKFVKYLPSFGWRPIVLTAHPPRGVMEPALLSEIPPAAIVRSSGYLEPGHLVDLARRIRVRKASTGEVSPADSGAETAHERARIRLESGFARRVVDNIFVPDRQVTWVVSGYRAAVRLIRKYAVTALYSSYNPGTAHLVAGLAKERTGLPWVADFRDPWLNSPLAPRWGRWQRFVAQRLERWTLTHCDHVTAVSDGLIADMRQDHPGLRFPPCTVVPNGFDPDDFQGRPHAARARFTMVYAGTVYPDRDPAPVLNAVRMLLEQRVLTPEDIDLRFVGTLPTEWQELIEAGDLNGVVTVTGQIGHPEAIAEMCSAHLLWMMITPGPASASILSLKVFEYLASGRPILYVGPHTAASEVLSHATGTHIVAYDDVAGIADRILRCFRTFSQRGPETFDRQRYLSQWTRPALTGQLATILNSLSQPSR